MTAHTGVPRGNPSWLMVHSGDRPEQASPSAGVTEHIAWQ